MFRSWERPIHNFAAYENFLAFAFSRRTVIFDWRFIQTILENFWNVSVCFVIQYFVHVCSGP